MAQSPARKVLTPSPARPTMEAEARFVFGTEEGGPSGEGWDKGWWQGVGEGWEREADDTNIAH